MLCKDYWKCYSAAIQQAKRSLLFPPTDCVWSPKFWLRAGSIAKLIQTASIQFMQSISSSGKCVCYFANTYTYIWIQLLASVVADQYGNGTNSESASACVLACASPWRFARPQEKLLCEKSSVPMPSMAHEDWQKKVPRNEGCHVHIRGKK